MTRFFLSPRRANRSRAFLGRSVWGFRPQVVVRVLCTGGLARRRDWNAAVAARGSILLRTRTGAESFARQNLRDGVITLEDVRRLNCRRHEVNIINYLRHRASDDIIVKASNSKSGVIHRVSDGRK